MKSIHTKSVYMILTIMVSVVIIFLFAASIRTNAILDADSEMILKSETESDANIINGIFSSVEQSVATIYNYAMQRSKTYDDFMTDEGSRARYTDDVSELGKSIAENTQGAMAVYLRYNPDDYGPTSGFWYTINLEDGSWLSAQPTDMSLYQKDDLEHVGWYYIPVETGKAMWMNPYYNKNLGVEMISYIIPYYYGEYTIGIIGMDISLERLRESVAKITTYDTGHAFLLTPGGDVIYHEDYPGGISFGLLPDSDKELVDKVLQLDTQVSHIYTDRNGIRSKLRVSVLKNGMILGVSAPLDEINKPRIVLMRHLALISLVIFILGVAIMLGWIRSITDPLKKMTQVAEQYAEGDFEQLMDTTSQDEIGVLSRSMQTMATSLKTQFELADSANRAKSLFLANMSHEIRTPINAILGFDEMILRESESSQIRSYAADIKSSGQTLLALINEILDFSKIESGKVEINLATYDFVPLAADLISMTTVRAQKKGLKFVYDIDEQVPTALIGDDIRLKEVIINLLTNAVKYTEDGEVKLTIKLLSRQEGRVRLLVSVKDTGIGIKKEDMEKLGKSFIRLDINHNRTIEGTGLGLNITVKYLELMGSRLEIESEYGKGSDFYFELEQQIVDPTPVGEFDTARDKLKNEAAESHKAFKAPGARILVTDDIEMNLKVFSSLLKGTDIHIDTASSGFEAIDLIRDNDYDIVFMDHMMPKMNGIETLENIHGLRILKRSTVIIALTANAVAGARQMYMDAGFNDYLTKPIDIMELEEKLLRYLPPDKVENVENAADTPAPERFENAGNGAGAALNTESLGTAASPVQALKAESDAAAAVQAGSADIGAGVISSEETDQEDDEMYKWVAVVDDDSTNLKMAGHILSKNNMRVTAIKSGAKLLEWLGGENTPDIILLDILMPEMDGFETYEALRKKPEGASIPVIFLTASEDNEALERCRALQAADIVKKPFVPDDLVSAVKNVIGE